MYMQLDRVTTYCKWDCSNFLFSAISKRQGKLQRVFENDVLRQTPLVTPDAKLFNPSHEVFILVIRKKPHVQDEIGAPSEIKNCMLKVVVLRTHWPPGDSPVQRFLR